MAEVPLVGGVILNQDNWAFLLHRSDHDQWELPGGRIQEGEVAV
ncbi:MAG: NUDIX domain-containing protein [Candidatus Saccharibacteria bacterium]